MLSRKGSSQLGPTKAFFSRLVLGITSAPAVFQHATDQVLQDIPGTQRYLDDIIVRGQEDSSHLKQS